MMSRLVYGLFLVQFLFSVILFVLGYWYWLLNFQLAFFSSMLVIFGSFYSYRQMVLKRLDTGEGEDGFVLEKLEDPHGLYDEEGVSQDEEADLKSVIQEEKARLKSDRQTVKKTVRSAPALFSPVRFIPYLVLVLSFIGLNNNHLLDIQAFLIGLGAGVVAAIFLGKAWISSANQ